MPILSPLLQFSICPTNTKKTIWFNIKICQIFNIVPILRLHPDKIPRLPPLIIEWNLHLIRQIIGVGVAGVGEVEVYRVIRMKSVSTSIVINKGKYFIRITNALIPFVLKKKKTFIV